MKINTKENSGKIFVAPSDTIYGLMAPALDPNSVENVYKLKKRSPKKPFIILISKFEDLKLFGFTKLSPEIKNYLQNVWPGKVSVVLQLPKASEKKFEYLHRETNSLAFRLPKFSNKKQSNNFGITKKDKNIYVYKNRRKLLKLLKRFGPLIAPSANPEGLNPASTISEAKKYFGNKVGYFSAGRSLKSKPSRLVAVDKHGNIKIIRR